MFYIKRIGAFFFLLIIMSIGFIIPWVIISSKEDGNNFIYDYVDDVILKVEDSIEKINGYIEDLKSYLPIYHVIESSDEFEMQLESYIETPLDTTLNFDDFMNLGKIGSRFHVINNTTDSFYLKFQFKFYQFSDIINGSFDFNIPGFSEADSIGEYFQLFFDWQKEGWIDLTTENNGWFTIDQGFDGYISPGGLEDSFYYFKKDETTSKITTTTDVMEATDFSIVDMISWRVVWTDDISGTTDIDMDGHIEIGEGNTRVFSMFDKNKNSILNSTHYFTDTSTDLGASFQYFNLFVSGNKIFSIVSEWLTSGFVANMTDAIDNLSDFVNDLDSGVKSGTDWVIIIVIAVISLLLIWFILLMYYFIITSYHKGELYAKKRARKLQKKGKID